MHQDHAAEGAHDRQLANVATRHPLRLIRGPAGPKARATTTSKKAAVIVSPNAVLTSNAVLLMGPKTVPSRMPVITPMRIATG